jgi:tellurite resistance protein TerB
MVAGKPKTRSPVLDETTGAFVKALASDSRQRIMALLADDVSLTVNEITQRCGLSQPATSEQLAILREAGLVSATRSGNHAHYRANATMIATCLSSLRILLIPGLAAAPAVPVEVNGAAAGRGDRGAPIHAADDPPIPADASANPKPGVGGPAPAEVVMADVFPDGDGREFTADEIMEAVSEYYGVAMQDLRGRRMVDL